MLTLLIATCLLPALNAQSDSNQSDNSRARIALFEPAGQKDDAALAAALSAVANSVELSLDLLQRYDVTRVPSADPQTDLDQVRAYCRKNHFDQAILGSGNARPEGGYHFRLMVYDRKTDKVTTDQKGDSNGALDMFDTTDTLVASMLDGLSGTHLLFGSLSVESDPAGVTVSVNGKDVGQAPLSLRGLPVGTMELAGRMDGREPAKTTVTISDGETTNASLTLPRSMGTLVIDMPKDGVAAIRSGEIGEKDVTGPGAQALPAGDYDVQASSSGLPTVTGKVTINRGESARWLPWPKGYLDVQSDPAGATIVVDGVEKGVTPLVVEVEPRALHRVELKKQDYSTYSADFSEDAGGKTLFSRTLTRNQPGGIIVGLASDGTVELAGKKLHIAGGDTTSISDVTPGGYVLRVTYDDGKTESRAVTIEEGKMLAVSFNYAPTSAQATFPKAEVTSSPKAYLGFRFVPDGYTVFVNDEKVGVTPLGQISVNAGSLAISFARTGEPVRKMKIDVQPNANAVVAWGNSADLPVTLPRRTIPPEARTDSWTGIEPLIDESGSPSTFVGQTAITFTRLYVCRDDRNFYWRVDFAGANPLLKKVSDANMVVCQLEVHFEQTKDLDLGINENFRLHELHAWTRTRDQQPIAVDFGIGEKMVVVKVPLGRILEVCKGPVGFRLHLYTSGSLFNPPKAGDQLSETRYVDFSK